MGDNSYTEPRPCRIQGNPGIPDPPHPGHLNVAVSAAERASRLYIHETSMHQFGLRVHPVSSLTTRKLL